VVGWDEGSFLHLSDLSSGGFSVADLGLALVETRDAEWLEQGCVADLEKENITLL